jgi:hypothetical protein
MHAHGRSSENRSERIERGDRADDDVPRQLIQAVLICVHSRASAYICVKSFLSWCIKATIVITEVIERFAQDGLPIRERAQAGPHTARSAIASFPCDPLLNPCNPC